MWVSFFSYFLFFLYLSGNHGTFNRAQVCRKVGLRLVCLLFPRFLYWLNRNVLIFFSKSYTKRRGFRIDFVRVNLRVNFLIWIENPVRDHLWMLLVNYFKMMYFLSECFLERVHGIFLLFVLSYKMGSGSY